MQLSHSIVLGAASMAVVWTGVLVCIDLPMAWRVLRPKALVWRNLLRRLEWRTQGLLLKLSFPLGLTMLLVSLNGNIPRYLLEHHHGEAELGVFAALAYLLVAGSTVVNALGQASSPRLAQYFSKSDPRGVKRLLYPLVGIGGLLGGLGVAVAILAGAPILHLLYGPEYAAFSEVLVLVMVGAGLSFVSSLIPAISSR